jgi:SAM-dependent MidA family methyltransferase
MALRERLEALIRLNGPLSVARYMEICLHDPTEGYYATRPDIAENGDFITAPMVSQIFGEILGLWAVDVWARLGRPRRFRLVELGPGAGVMMIDILRAARAAPDFLAACELWLVETSAPLKALQAASIVGPPSPRWASRLDEIADDAPVILLANEFLDCLPVRQAAHVDDGWRERCVGVDRAGRLAFVFGDRLDDACGPAAASSGALREWSATLETIGREVGALIARAGGAGLFIDYGRIAPGHGDTLQAIRGHRKECPLANPGAADLTAHVDFPAFLNAARGSGARTPTARTQGEFLAALGAEARGAALARSRPDRADRIGRQLHRLIAGDQMGDLFKVAAVLSPGLTCAGFEAE